MITQLTEKPEGCFANLSDKQFWFEMSNKNGVYGYVAIDILSTFASFHAQPLKWSHGVAKSAKKDWIELKSICRKLGVKQLIASNADIEDTRWPKFIKLFNFPHPQAVLISKQEL